MHICRVSCEQLLAILRAVVEGASRLKRLRLSFLDPMDIVDVVDVDKDLIGRAREAVGEFFIFILHKIVAIVDLVKGHSEKQGGLP